MGAAYLIELDSVRVLVDGAGGALGKVAALGELSHVQLLALSSARLRKPIDRVRFLIGQGKLAEGCLGGLCIELQCKLSQF